MHGPSTLHPYQKGRVRLNAKPREDDEATSTECVGLEAHVSRQQSPNRSASNIDVRQQDLWLPTFKPGPFKQGCVASLLEGTSLKNLKPTQLSVESH